MSRQELIEYLLRDIENYGFEIFSDEHFPIPAIINIESKIMIQNPQLVTPFGLAHERSHIVNHDLKRGRDCDTTNPQESRAHREAILLLWDLFEKQGGTFEHFSLFVDLTGSPYDFASLVISKEYTEMYEAINEIFEEEIQVKINKEEMKQYIIDYISAFDVIESLNVYHFLDQYHLSYNFYEMAAETFKNIIDAA